MNYIKITQNWNKLKLIRDEINAFTVTRHSKRSICLPHVILTEIDQSQVRRLTTLYKMMSCLYFQRKHIICSNFISQCICWKLIHGILKSTWKILLSYPNFQQWKRLIKRSNVYFNLKLVLIFFLLKLCIIFCVTCIFVKHSRVWCL